MFILSFMSVRTEYCGIILTKSIKCQCETVVFSEMSTYSENLKSLHR